jgi:hypothetical protein
MMTILHSCWAEDPQGGSIVTEVGWKSWWNHMAVSPKTWNLACNKRKSIPVIVKTDLETVFVSYLVQELCSKHSSKLWFESYLLWIFWTQFLWYEVLDKQEPHCYNPFVTFSLSLALTFQDMKFSACCQPFFTLPETEWVYMTMQLRQTDIWIWSYKLHLFAERKLCKPCTLQT